MGYQGTQNVPVHRYLYESECCSVHPLAKKTSTFSCKDLRKTLSQYVMSVGKTGWLHKVKHFSETDNAHRGIVQRNILTQNILFLFFPIDYSICWHIMSYSILETKGTKISRRFITNIWWKRKNPYLCGVMDYDKLLETRYRCLTLRIPVFFFYGTSNRGDVLLQHSETIRSLPKV